MSFNVGSVIAKFEADTKDFQEGLKNAKTSVNGVKDKTQNLSDTLVSMASKAVLAFGAFQVAQKAINYLTEASGKAEEYEKALLTLGIISERFGVSQDDAKKAAERLGKELKIGVGASANGLQNLLKSGLNLDQATDLMKRFTNEALTGKASSLSLAQAVENLSFAYATNNSAIGNLSGINENFQDIIDKGKQSLIDKGMAVEKITDDMAKYEGIVNLTNLTEGSAEKMAGTLTDKKAQLGMKIEELQLKIGQGLNPVLAQFVGYILDSGILDNLIIFAQNVGNISMQLANMWNWLQINVIPTLQALYNQVATALSPSLMELWNVLSSQLIPALMELWNVVSPVVIPVLQFLAYVAGILVKEGFKQFIQILKTTIEALTALIQASTWVANQVTSVIRNMVEAVKSSVSGIKDILTRPFNDAWNSIRDTVNKIKDNLDFTKRHSPSVVDIVKKGVGEVNRALDGLQFNTSLTPQASAMAVSNGGKSTQVNDVYIDMNGAFIGSENSASQMGEIIGDQIIKRLQVNLKF
jgi:hypothetical protein